MTSACRLRVAFLALAGFLATNAEAQSTDRYSLQGFGGWAMGNTNNENFYGDIAGPETEYNNYYFALNVAGQPTEKLSIRGQVFWGQDLGGERLDLDYVFAQWTQSRALRFRLGKSLSPLGLYSETYDVGTLRPFYRLPALYDRKAGFLPKSVTGGSVSGLWPLGESWELHYEAFGGEIHYQETTFEVPTGTNPATRLPVFTTNRREMIGRNMLGAKAVVAAPEMGLDFGAAVAHSDLEQSVNGGPRQPFPAGDDVTIYEFYARLERGPLSVRGEFARGRTDTGGRRGGFVEAAYRIGKHWQVAGTFDKLEITADPGSLFASIPEPMKRHESLGAAVNFWVSPEFVVKANYYWVDGNLIAGPTSPTLAFLQKTLDDSTQVVIVGAQFSF